MHDFDVLKQELKQNTRFLLCLINPGDITLLKEHLQNLIWINFQDSTEYKAWQSIAKAMGIKYPAKGAHISLIKEQIAKFTPNTHLALAGIEYLSANALNSILYFLARSYFKLLLFSTRPLSFYARVSSSLTPMKQLDLRPFTSQLFAEKLASHDLTSDQVQGLLKLCNHNKNIILQALNTNIRTFSDLKEHVAKLFILHSFKQMSLHQKIFFYAICLACNEDKTAKSGTTYEIYRHTCLSSSLKPYTERTLLKWLHIFHENGLVEIKKLKGGAQGKTTQIKLCVPVKIKEIFKILKPLL